MWTYYLTQGYVSFRPSLNISIISQYKFFNIAGFGEQMKKCIAFYEYYMLIVKKYH